MAGKKSNKIKDPWGTATAWFIASCFVWKCEACRSAMNVSRYKARINREQESIKIASKRMVMNMLLKRY